MNHSEGYSDNGKNTNQVESFFAQLRSIVDGQHHHVSPQHLHQYANQATRLEDNRRQSNGSLVAGLAGCAMASPVSRIWKGYWQRAE